MAELFYTAFSYPSAEISKGHSGDDDDDKFTGHHTRTKLWKWVIIHISYLFVMVILGILIRECVFNSQAGWRFQKCWGRGKERGGCKACCSLRNQSRAVMEDKLFPGYRFCYTGYNSFLLPCIQSATVRNSDSQWKCHLSVFGRLYILLCWQVDSLQLMQIYVGQLVWLIVSVPRDPAV